MNRSEHKLCSFPKSLVRNQDLFAPAPFNAAESEKTGASNYSYWKSTLRTFFKSKAVVALVVLVCGIILMSFLYPVFSSVDPTLLL